MRKAPESKPNQRKVSIDRRAAIAELYKTGATLQEVSQEYGISRERVRQIVKSMGIGKTEGGSAIRSLERAPDKTEAARKRVERQEVDCMARWGMSLDAYKAHVAEHGSSTKSDSPLRKYVQHRKNAQARGLAWEFTFPEWWRVWQESGKWDQRGRGDGYVMARYGDGDTPYSPSTVYICTQSQNAKDGYLVVPSAERRAGSRSATNAKDARVAQMRASLNKASTSKLTADEVLQIRSDTRTGAQIAASHGICEATVSQIKNRKIWKHV